METLDEEKDPSVIPEDIKEFVRAAHKAQRESRPDESWRITPAPGPEAVDAPYKQDEDSMDEPDMANDPLKMAQGGVVPGFAGGAYPDLSGLLSQLAPEGSGMLAPDPGGAEPPMTDAAPTPMPAPLPPPQPPAMAMKQPDAAPIVPRGTMPDMTDADYASKAAKMIGTDPGQQSDLLKAIGAAQQRGSIGTAVAGIGDAIASGGTLGKVNPGAAARSQEMIQDRTKQGLEGMQALQGNREKTTALAEKLQAQDPNSPLSKYAQKAYGDVGKKIGIDLSHAPASLIADVTGKGVQELSDEAQLAVRKEGIDIQRGQLEATKENNKAQRLHDEAVLAETAKDRAAAQELAKTGKVTEAATKLGTRTLGNKLESLIPGTSANIEKNALEKEASGLGETGPYGAETVKNGKTYEWSAETGKYHLKQ